jgi:Predicted amidophosphoribosyltransferases
VISEQRIAGFRNILVSGAGGYLRNPIRETGVTCQVCTTPVDGYNRCIPCNRYQRLYGSQLADSVAPLIYGVAGTQSAYIMRSYKAAPPVQEHRRVVGLLCLLALAQHGDCPSELVGSPVTHWSTVPSLPARPISHPLRQIVVNLAPGVEAPLIAANKVANSRSLSDKHFHAAAALPSGAHVLLIEDTWASGGHAQSAALALRAAGAAHVSVLVVARWINEGYGSNARFVQERLTQDFDPLICPWTGSTCP